MRQFKLPLHLIVGTDDLRPAMQHVYFKDGYMYATDARLAIRASIKEFTAFGKEETKLLNEKFVSREVFEKIYKSKSTFNITEHGFENNSTIYKFSKEPGKFPSLEKVFQIELEKRRDYTSNGVKVFSFNTDFAARLGKGMRLNSFETLKFSFTENDQPILVTNELYEPTDLIGILTPIRLSK